MVLVPIQAAIEECLVIGSFVDLSMHIAQDLLSRNESIRRIIDSFVLTGLISKEGKDSLGYLAVNQKEIFFFSDQMAKDIEENILRPMIKVYAMRRAIEEEENMHTADNDVKEYVRNSDRKSKHTKEKRSESESFCTYSDVVPLNAVVAEIRNIYPGLSDVQSCNYDGNLEGSWDDDDAVERGVISQFCSHKLYTERFRDMCSNAVKVDLEKIISSKKGVCSRRDQSATTFKSIEASFEDNDCFAASSYLLQMLSKFSLSTASVKNESNSGTIMNEFLLFCANFARRVTQFALYKHGIDNIFCFSDAKADDSDFFCSPVDFSVRCLISVQLSCVDDNEGQPQDPISLLHEFLPEY